MKTTTRTILAKHVARAKNPQTAAGLTAAAAVYETVKEQGAEGAPISAIRAALTVKGIPAAMIDLILLALTQSGTVTERDGSLYYAL